MFINNSLAQCSNPQQKRFRIFSDFSGCRAKQYRYCYSVSAMKRTSSSLRKLKLNRKGFYWKPDGFFYLTGEELAVPPSQKTG